MNGLLMLTNAATFLHQFFYRGKKNYTKDINETIYRSSIIQLQNILVIFTRHNSRHADLNGCAPSRVLVAHKSRTITSFNSTHNQCQNKVKLPLHPPLTAPRCPDSLAGFFFQPALSAPRSEETHSSPNAPLSVCTTESQWKDQRHLQFREDYSFWAALTGDPLQQAGRFHFIFFFF